MRVLFVSDVYFPRVNGVSTSIRAFRTDLAAHGVESLLVAPGYGADDGSEPGVLRVPGLPVPGDPEDRRMRWRALVRTLESVPPGVIDLVHVHTPFLAHYAGVRFARRRGLPCVATFHTFFEEYLHHYVPVLPRPLGRCIARHFTRSQCRDLAALIAPSEPMQVLLRAYGIVTPVHVVPTGLPADRFRPGDAARFRREHGIPAERPLVTYVGRVAYEKNIAFLLHAFVEVRRAEPAALMLIAGEGPAQDGLRRLAARLGIGEDVRFIGYLERDRGLLDCYAAADAFVFASRTETQGLVLLEALAQGAPVVSTAQLGARSILQGECGAVIVPERLDEFAAAVVRLLRAPRLRRLLASQGRAHAARWSSAAMAGRLAEVYRCVRESALHSRCPAQETVSRGGHGSQAGVDRR